MQRLMVAALWLGSLLALPACHETPTASAAEPSAPVATPVRLTPVERGAIVRRIRVGGALHRKNEADLGFRTGGVVAQVLVEEGAHVRRGQLLARLEGADVSARLTHADAALAQAERDLTRTTKLRQSGASPELELQNADTGAALARATRAAAAVSVRDTALYAVDDGTIDRRFVEAGEVVAPGAPVFRLAGLSKGVVVSVALSDVDALGLQLGMPAEVVLDAAPERTLAAVISQVATVASPGTGTFDVEVKLQAPLATWLSGMTAKVIIARTTEAATHVPIAALAHADGKHVSVFSLYPDGTARKLETTLLRLSGERAVLEELPADVTDVVAEGGNALREGELVRVVALPNVGLR